MSFPVTTCIPNWVQPPERLQLSQSAIHLWRVSLDLPAEGLELLLSSLSEEEQSRAQRFVFETDRNRFIAARGWVRHILSQYLTCSPHQLQFGYTAQGKPFLQSARSVEFNVSHSGELALCAVAHHPIGVDLEKLRFVDAEALARRFFSPTELTQLQSHPPHQQQQWFLRCWTLKESFLKATGQGLMGLKQVEVRLTPGVDPSRLTLASHDRQEKQWSLLQFVPAEGYFAALAIATPICDVVQWYTPDRC